MTPIDFRRCQTLVEYNLDHAAAPFPEHVDERNGLRGYTAAGVGLVNDIWVGPRRCTLDFLPGGAPKPDDDDRMGTVVASCWGSPLWWCWPAMCRCVRRGS